MYNDESMKLLRNKFIFFLFAALLLFVLPLPVFAQTNQSIKQKIVILEKDQIVNRDYFTAGSQVIIDGTINGDAYIAGGQVDINGIVNGDLLVVGGQINIRGTVSQNIRAAGGSIVIEGNAGKNVSVAGGSLTVYKTAKITGNTVIAGGNARIEGNILGNFTAGIGMLSILPDTTIRGNVDYWSNNKATVSSNAKVLGSTVFHQTQFKTNPKNTAITRNRMAIGINIFFTIYGFVFSLILGLLFVWLFPVFTQKAADLVRNRFWLSALIGFIALIIVPIVGIIFAVTILGIPVALALMFAYMVLIYVAKIFVSLMVGKFVAQKAKWNLNSYWAFVIGIFIYYAVGIIPVLGGLAKFVFTLSGIGAILIQKKTEYSMLREKKII